MKCQIESALDFEKYCKNSPICPCCKNLCSCSNCYLKRKHKKIIKSQEDFQIEGPIVEVIDWRKRKYFRSKLHNLKTLQKKNKSISN